jgi:crotonobetainyl-CoA:carnitine CoA-transferase CaiB-like acyl-CoA transferase
MMGLWEARKTGRGQVIDLAQYEAVAQTQGNALPLYTGWGARERAPDLTVVGFKMLDLRQFDEAIDLAHDRSGHDAQG